MKKTDWRGQECPPLYEVQRNGGMLQLTLYADPKQENNADGNDQWVADALTLPIGVIDYDTIVDALIQHKYPYSKMESVTSNYLMETDVSVLIGLLQTTQNFNKLRQAMASWLNNRDSEIVAEYNTMQEYRKYAKQLARTIVNEFEPNPEEE